jgi:hypothetical protein
MEEFANLPEQTGNIFRMNARIPFGNIVTDLIIAKPKHRLADFG